MMGPNFRYAKAYQAHPLGPPLYVANYYVSMDEKSEAWKVGNAARQPNTDI